ncbi:E3 ubiquitin-protein ligase PDZRN3-like isoform X1 [Dreissena polymorpha]|uniref:E3 ubiquitin-protein ligase PDZRN3-like isoform X1 n=2 Tax=Dreissena polymorpha TaxID=45954 RepID=UPI002264F66F|nr:E3 ubiquitin-protein ligase PDZRN3-like isoform X1 [Dreissena polymorpha]
MGFDVEKFVCSVSEDRKCALCHHVLDNPVQSPCGHVFCSSCILPWVVQHGCCPFRCQGLNTGDLTNVLALRDVILNMKVVCEYEPNGCSEQPKLRDYIAHIKVCGQRLVPCTNRGCGELLRSVEELGADKNNPCLCKPRVPCGGGCGATLKEVDNGHMCVEYLKARVHEQEEHVRCLEGELLRLRERLSARELELVSRIKAMRKRLQIQGIKLVQQARNMENVKAYTKTVPTECESKCSGHEKMMLVLERVAGSLGFNIMGGLQAFESNNNNGNTSDLIISNNNNNQHVGMTTEGIIVSKVMVGGPAEKTGLCTHDQIVKVNGRDLSQASHEEAVEAFRTAEEPIVVEVLRRVNKNKMKTRPTTSNMVSIGTQTEEDIYGYNRPPTPPPSFYPFPYSGLLEPSSRRPLMFSQSTDNMGLTDIEMTQFDYDDQYYDERQYEEEYEEVVLQRTSEADKLGLTLCYGSSEDGITDIFVGEVEPYSVAAKDGRIREGDQIIQINGVDVHSRDQAIKLFSERASDITLLVVRPQLQFDDGFMEEHNVVLDELQMDILEKHHHDNMQIMASMLARGHHFDEEGGTTDTGTTENSSNKHEKDSGVGRTDESTKNDESSEQDVFDNDSMMGTRKSGSSKGSHSYNGDIGEHNYSNDSFVSNGDVSYEIPENDINNTFRESLQNRCDRNNMNRVISPRKERKSSESTESSIDKELAQLNREMEALQMEGQEMANNHTMKGQKDVAKCEKDLHKTLRTVPRMGTRIDKAKTGMSPGPESSDSLGRRDTPPTPKMGQTRFGGKIAEGSVSTSAYNTGESCRSTPLTLELNPASDEGDKGFKNSMLCLATTGTTITPPLPTHSDTEKQTQTPARSHDCSSDENYMSIANVNNHRSVVENNKKNESVTKTQLNSGESLQDLYMQYADVMYTNSANLEHTIQIQQKLFQQQMEQKTAHRRRQSNSPVSRNGNSVSGYQSPNNTQPSVKSNEPSVKSNEQTPPDSGQSQMEWVVKRRPDGTRYITRRPIRSKMLKERAKKISEERCGMTTDDDAMSELKTGRYWTKEERKRHLEKARDYKKRREMMARAKMETVKEADEKKDIVELSHRKMNKQKSKKVLDDFTTVREIMAHGNKSSENTKGYKPLLSVTTV